MLLDQVKSGSASRLVLVGIEGGDDAARTAASRRLGAALRATPYFASVDNGDTTALQETGRFVFAHRYALSPAVDAARFEVEGLRAAIDDTLSLLGTPAGSLIKPILLRDPTGETMRIVEAMTPAQAPKSDGGVWVSRTAPRAVLVLTTRADGADLDGQQQALDAVRTAFDAEARRPGADAGSETGLRVVVSGAGSFARRARALSSEVERLAIWGRSSVFLLCLLSLAASLAVSRLQVANRRAPGITAVSLGFASARLTLGFARR